MDSGKRLDFNNQNHSSRHSTLHSGGLSDLKCGRTFSSNATNLLPNLTVKRVLKISLYQFGKVCTRILITDAQFFASQTHSVSVYNHYLKSVCTSLAKFAQEY